MSSHQSSSSITLKWVSKQCCYYAVTLHFISGWPNVEEVLQNDTVRRPVEDLLSTRGGLNSPGWLLLDEVTRNVRATSNQFWDWITTPNMFGQWVSWLALFPQQNNFLNMKKKFTGSNLNMISLCHFLLSGFIHSTYCDDESFVSPSSIKIGIYCNGHSIIYSKTVTINNFQYIILA